MVRCCASIGGAEGTRTPDPHTASVVLSQLSYGPILRNNGLTRDPLDSLVTVGDRRELLCSPSRLADEFDPAHALHLPAILWVADLLLPVVAHSFKAFPVGAKAV